jgi:glycosyltransferase involved in cell wall biosynthesis
MPTVDILLPTRNRLASLVMTLAGVAGQSHTYLRVIVADQSDTAVADAPGVAALRRIIAARGGVVDWHARPPRHGIAEQRQFLLDLADAPNVLYLDDDVFMEPWVLARLLDVIAEQRCGFVGAFPAGLSFHEDVRAHQQIIEWWDGRVRPEVVEPGTPRWERAQLHRAANQWHVARALPPGEHRLYKVAWVASCVLYDRARLAELGGFAFWPRLPRYHSGEEVLVQNLLLRRFGGCAILPSGTYHAELPSTVLNERGTVDGHALDLLTEMVARYAPTVVEMEPA